MARRKGKLGAKTSWRNDRAMLKSFCAFTVPDTQRNIADLPATAVTEGDVEAFLGALRAAGRRRQHAEPVSATAEVVKRMGRP